MPGGGSLVAPRLADPAVLPLGPTVPSLVRVGLIAARPWSSPYPAKHSRSAGLRRPSMFKLLDCDTAVQVSLKFAPLSAAPRLCSSTPTSGRPSCRPWRTKSSLQRWCSRGAGACPSSRRRAKREGGSAGLALLGLAELPEVPNAALARSDWIMPRLVMAVGRLRANSCIRSRSAEAGAAAGGLRRWGARDAVQPRCRPLMVMAGKIGHPLSTAVAPEHAGGVDRRQLVDAPKAREGPESQGLNRAPAARLRSWDAGSSTPGVGRL